MDMDNLGGELGFEPSEIQRYIQPKEITETSPGKTNYASPIPSASIPFSVPPEDASAAADEVSTSKARGRSSPRAQPEAVVNFISIFAVLEKQKDEWAKNEEIHVQKYASIIKAAYNGQVEEVRRHLHRNKKAIHERTQGGRNALHAASTNGHLEIVQLLVETNLTINREDAAGITPLRMAVAGNHVEVTKYLLRQKADPNIADHTGWTPLHSAALNDRADIIKCLKASGADVTKQTKRGYTALILASVNGHVGCVKELVEIKAGTNEMEAERRHYQLNMVDDAGFSALHCAALKGHAEIIKILLREGALPEKRSESGMVPLTLAAAEGHLSCIRKLFPYTDKDDVSEAIAKAETRGHNIILRYIMVTSDDNSWSRLHNAAWKGETGIIRSLIEDGRDIDEQSGEHGYMPLMLAIWQDHLECTKIIIEEGNANVNKADNNSCSPLHLAVGLQNEEVMKVLLANGAQPDALNNEGKGALHEACFKGDLNAIKLLINAAADIDIKSNDNSTPLLLAAEYGHQSCVEELVSHGADPTMRDNDGDSLVHVASLGGRVETLKYVLGLQGMSELISSKNDVGQLPLHSAAKEGNVDCVELLLAQGLRQEGEDCCSLIDEQDCQGRTPLYLAVEGGFAPVIETLIEARADLNIQTNDGKTCLHLLVTLWSVSTNPDNKVQTTNGSELSNHNSTPVLLAAEYSHQSCVEKLIAHGADPMKRDNDGDSLVHVASLGGRSETLMYVLDLEGMLKLISSKNNAGHLPLHSAGRKGNLECVELLLDRRVGQGKGKEGERSCPLIDEQDCQGRTPLHLAVEGGFSPVIEALIEAGADLNMQTNDGKTCLHLVVTLWGGPEHPDKTVQTTNGFQPVVSIYPEYEPLTENEKLLLYLLDKGASCTMFDASGDTPIHYTNTHRLWQLVLSRIPEEKRNDLLDELDVESKRIKRTVQTVIGPEAGKIHLSRYGVHLAVPAGALDKDQNISITLLQTLPVPGIQGEEMMASFGVELKPGGLKFKHPVQITLPHCASVVDTTDVKVVLYHFRGGNLTTQEVTAGNLAEIPACIVREKELELHIDEFCFWFAFFKSSTGKQMMCCPYSKKASVHSADLRLYLAIDVKGVEKDLINSARLRDAERIGDSKPFFVKWRNGDVHVAVMNDKREEKAESIRIEEIECSNQTYRDFAELKTEHYENLTMRVFQGAETRIVCNNPLKKTSETEVLKNFDVERSAQKLKDAQLIKVSQEIPYKKYNYLCVLLGCSLNSAKNILAKHHQDYPEALLEVLMDWNQQTSCNHRDKLIESLIEVEVKGLITVIFPDFVQDH